MELKLRLLFAVLVFFTTRNTIAQSGTNLKNMLVSENHQDKGTLNINNTDNKIFIPGREFVYKYHFVKDKKILTSYVVFDTSCLSKPNKNCLNWKLDEKEIKEVSPQIYGITEIKLKVFANDAGSFLSKTQTIIKYDYYQDSIRIFQGEITGVVEDSINIFLHPPRQHAFSITEFNAFPNLRFPLTIGKKWNAFIDIPSIFFTKAHLDNREPPDLLHMIFAYEVIGNVTIETAFGNKNCTIIEGSGTSSIGNTRSKFYYNDELGFIKIEYDNINDTTLTLDLQAVN